MELTPATPGNLTRSGDSDRTASFLEANAFAGLFLLPAALFTILPYGMIWGFDRILVGLESATWPLWRLLLWFPAAALVHELLHVAGFLLGGAGRTDVRIGVHLRVLTPYAGCSVPLAASSYRWAVGLPLLVLGGLPALLALLSGNDRLAAGAFIMVAAAAGDVFILWLIRDLPRRSLVLDHPGRIGCVVLSERCHGGCRFTPVRT